MTIIQKFNNFIKKNNLLLVVEKAKKLKDLNFNYAVLTFVAILILIVFYTSTNMISQKKIEKKTHLQKITNTNEFFKFNDFSNF